MEIKTTMNVVIGVVGDDKDASDMLYAGLKEFPAEKIVLIIDEENLDTGEKIKDDLKKFRIPVEFEMIKDRSSLEEVFMKIRKIKEREIGKKIIINVDTDYISSCLSLSAAFVNGVQAIGFLNDDIIAYPIMKFSYYTALSDKKLGILEKIYKSKKFGSLEELSKEVKMSLPLIVYHIRGTRDKPGLEEMGLVQTERMNNRLAVSLTTLGNLIIKGHVDIDGK